MHAGDAEGLAVVAHDNFLDIRTIAADYVVDLQVECHIEPANCYSYNENLADYSSLHDTNVMAPKTV